LINTYDKGNSLSLVAPARIAHDLNDYKLGKKSPVYGKRNFSLGNQRTYDERNSNKFNGIGPLDFDTKMNILNNSSMTNHERINNRYKLHSLIDQKRKSSSNRK